MRIHILGICGTFMAGVALLAKQQGHQVSGSDVNVYPPMSTQLSEQGITVLQGYLPEHLQPNPDLVIIGNALSRGNPAVEYVLRENLSFTSGPAWLYEAILKERWVLAVAGTHGKTTTSSMLAWILESAGLSPGFLIGGVPNNFATSARLGNAPFFVIEADEYDSAFFDKRSKFLHYHPRTLILNNLEYDHADIFPDLAAIQGQCHYLVRTVPDNGLIILPSLDHNLAQVLEQGCWTPRETFGVDPSAKWQAKHSNLDNSQFDVYLNDQLQGQVNWVLCGEHNLNNALAAIAAAHHLGVNVAQAIHALQHFQTVKRRLEVRGQVCDITVYDDFAHHPTAIMTTLAGLRARVGAFARIWAILELGSYTMRQGVHRKTIAPSLKHADSVMVLRPAQDWGVEQALASCTMPAKVFDDVSSLIQALVNQAQAGDHLIVMSNTGFGGIHERLLTALTEKAKVSC